MIEETIFMKIRSAFFHDTQHSENRIENRYLQIKKYLRIELRPKMNILSVM